MTHRLAILALAACVFACDKPADTGPRVPAKDVTGPGVVTGRVIFNGPKPTLNPLRNEPCCDGAPPNLPDESVVLNDDGTLANVFVYLEGGPRATGRDLPRATLDQKNCQYVPHVVGVVVAQPLRVTSSDPTVHNVHYKPQKNSAANHWMKTAGEFADTSFSAAEFIKTGCDVHPWMSAIIGVFENPLFSITGPAGSFEIKNVPAGSYTLVAYHERYGRMTKPVTISGETPVAIDFTYQPPAK